MRKMKEQQRSGCSCAVCGRKRCVLRTTWGFSLANRILTIVLRCAQLGHRRRARSTLRRLLRRARIVRPASSTVRVCASRHRRSPTRAWSLPRFRRRRRRSHHCTSRRPRQEGGRDRQADPRPQERATRGRQEEASASSSPRSQLCDADKRRAQPSSSPPPPRWTSPRRAGSHALAELSAPPAQPLDASADESGQGQGSGCRAPRRPRVRRRRGG